MFPAINYVINNCEKVIKMKQKIKSQKNVLFTFSSSSLSSVLRLRR